MRLKLIWTETAANDLAEIVAYIRQDDREAARLVAKTIFDAVARLPLMPSVGRPRSADASRELVFAPWPYLALYEVIDDKVYVKAIRHTSRDWRERA